MIRYIALLTALLFLPATFNVATLFRLLQEMNVTPRSLIKQTNPKGKEFKVTIGFHEDGHVSCVQGDIQKIPPGD